MILIHKKMGVLAKHVSTDGSRPFLEGVHVTNNQLEVTDGHVAVRVKITTPTPAEDFPVVSGLPQTNGNFSTIIPADAWAQAFKAVPKKTRAPILENVAIAHSENRQQIVLASTDLGTARVSPTTPIAGQFPNVDNVFPKDTPATTIRVNAAQLSKLLASLATLAEDRTTTVTLNIYSPNSPMLLTVDTPTDGYTVEALVAPVCPK